MATLDFAGAASGEPVPHLRLAFFFSFSRTLAEGGRERLNIYLCEISLPLYGFSDGPRQDGPSAKDHIYFLSPPPPPGDLYWIGPDKHSSTLIGRHKPSAVHIHIASSHC